jgi:retron-type reverse transcriptase
LRGGGLIRNTHDGIVDFADITSIKALNAAWVKFAAGKRSRRDVREYQKHLSTNIRELHDSMMSGTYRHGSYQPFTVFDPKQRSIHKASVRDRLVHQAVVTAIEPAFERRFIYDSYSCRKGKGTHAGVARLQQFLRQASANDTRQVYVLKCDVRQFFASIDQDSLFELIARRVGGWQMLRLVDTIIRSYATQPSKGIPLGNITSQLFANIYLHELDWFMKQSLGAHHYLRYCDDFVIVSTDRAYLNGLIDPITQFLNERLRLQLHPHKVSIRSWRQGVDFLGYVTKPEVTLIRTVTRKRMLAKTGEHNLSSYLGICSHADAHELANLLKTVAWKRDDPEFDT